MPATVSPSTSLSSLWGSQGEFWSPNSRLPDFSHAGYHEGNKPLPNLPRGRSIKEFGALGDGIQDDTAAFLQAIKECREVIEIPAGRYRITQILDINRPGVVLRGEGPEKSILLCPVHLTDLRPDWGATTGGQRTSNYSWSGGILWIQGNDPLKKRFPIAAPQKRGACQIQLASTEGLSPGQRIVICLSDEPENSLARHLYSGDAGETNELKGSTIARLLCRIVSIEGNRIEFDRPLRFDIETQWQPEVALFQPSVQECGVENLGFEFPEIPYAGHFKELGHNAIAIEHAADCWVRNIRIHNSDSGIFASGCFCSFVGVSLSSSRPADTDLNCTGHHGVYFGGDDNLFSGFHYQTRFIHDISVSHCAGNVFSEGEGVDLCFDHHKRAPYENLFTNINLGLGSRPWTCGGGHALGKHCAARGTFWNLQSAAPLPYPPEKFGPPSMNLVGLTYSSASVTDPSGKWLEQNDGQAVTPANLHLAQLQKRKNHPL